MVLAAVAAGGGVIPEEDRNALRKQGVGMLFGPGTPTGELVDYIRKEVARRRAG